MKRSALCAASIVASGMMLGITSLVQPDWQPAEAKPPYNQGHRWDRYINVRYRYSIEYPSDLLIARGESDNSDGQQFEAARGTSALIVWGEHAGYNDTGDPVPLTQVYKDELEAEGKDGKRITYKALGKDWYVLSGRDHDKIFYRKTMLEGGDLKRFYLYYPASQKKYFDNIVERISRTFHSTGAMRLPL